MKIGKTQRAMVLVLGLLLLTGGDPCFGDSTFVGGLDIRVSGTSNTEGNSGSGNSSCTGGIGNHIWSIVEPGRRVYKNSGIFCG